MDKHILLVNSLLDARVCSEGTYDEALEWIRRVNPAGTQNNWDKHEDGTFAPIKCADNPERTHYMFSC
jgi:hypothetical protein